MKNVTYRWNTFQLYDYRGVEEHLSAMAAQGWRLEKASGSLWKYRRAEPASLRYAVRLCVWKTSTAACGRASSPATLPSCF